MSRRTTEYQRQELRRYLSYAELPSDVWATFQNVMKDLEEAERDVVQLHRTKSDQVQRICEQRRKLNKIEEERAKRWEGLPDLTSINWNED